MIGEIKLRIMYLMLNILYTNRVRNKLYVLTQKNIEETLIVDGVEILQKTIFKRRISI